MDPRANETVATPTRERAVTSYKARRAYRPGVAYPPAVPGVKDMIDIHCHAHEGQQDPLALAKWASESEMGGILFKSIGPFSGNPRPMDVLRSVQEDLQRWSDETGIAPIKSWGGYAVAGRGGPPSVEALRAAIDDGVKAAWLPINNHANSYNKVGGMNIWFDKSASPGDHTEPLPWEEAKRVGHYTLDDNGKLKPLYEEIVRILADNDVALFYGHATHPEIDALTELVVKLNFKRAVVDHPFSPFIDLSIPKMKDLASAGVFLNFTFDELSPLLGVDPKKMYEAIRAVGVEQFTLSSDAGEPLFPNSVECMRLISGYMAAFGLNAEEVRTVTVTNPARVVGLSN